MAVKIRLKRMGKIREPHYRIVVADSRTKRDGKSIEQIGQYHPKSDPSIITVDSERAQYWLSVGAQPSEPVLAILKKTGDWQKFKGEPAPDPLLQPAARPDKQALFEAALREAHREPETEAVSTKKAAAKKSSGSKADRPAKADKPEKNDTADKAEKPDAKADKPEDKAAEPAEAASTVEPAEAAAEQQPAAEAQPAEEGQA